MLQSRSVPDRSAYNYVPSLPNAPVPSLPEAGQLLTNQNALLIQVQAEKHYVQVKKSSRYTIKGLLHGKSCVMGFCYTPQCIKCLSCLLNMIVRFVFELW